MNAALSFVKTTYSTEVNPSRTISNLENEYQLAEMYQEIKEIEHEMDTKNDEAIACRGN